MQPLRTLPPLSALEANPSLAAEAVDTLVAQSAQMTARLSRWQPHVIATDTGRLYSALTMPPDTVLDEVWPQDIYVPAGSSEDQMGLQSRLSAGVARATALHDLATTHQFHPVAQDSNGNTIEAFAQFVGYTAAVPLVVHHLQSTNEWLCMGGRMRTYPGANTLITVATTKLSLMRGHLGLLLTLRAGARDTSHHILAAEWFSLTETGTTLSEIGSLDKESGQVGPGRLFVPLYAVRNDGGGSAPTWTPMVFLQPIERNSGGYGYRLPPSGPSGTLLNE